MDEIKKGNDLRKEWMPHSADIEKSINMLEFFKLSTGNSVEIHYALIEGLNDTEEDAKLLCKYLKNRNIPVKFLFYNEKPELDFVASKKEKLKVFENYFKQNNIGLEYYIPPGLDIGASCGQFLLDYYKKYNSII